MKNLFKKTIKFEKNENNQNHKKLKLNRKNNQI